MKVTAKFEGVLFDLDGTLLDSAPDLVDTAFELYQKYGVSVGEIGEINHLVSDGAMGFIHYGFGHDYLEAEVLKEEFLQSYVMNLGRRSALFATIESLLHTLAKQQVPWGIVTNKLTDLTELTLTHFPILNQAKTIICGDTLSVSKPSPEPILLACRQLNLSPNQVIYVGDHKRDITAGQKAGCYTIAASYGYISAKENIMTWQADAVIDSPQNILKLLQNAE